MANRLRSDAPGVREIRPDELTPEKRARTDTGNAERYVAMFGDRLRHCHPWKLSLVWDGTRWRLDELGRALAMTKKVARSIYREAAKAASEQEREEIAKWAAQSEKLERRRAMLTLATHEDGIPVLHTDLDRRPLLLNLKNGTLDLENLCLREHDRADLLTTLAPVNYDPKAECPVFEAFMERVLPDEAIRDFTQTALGYSMSGEVGEQVMFFSHGSGANGKSTLMMAIHGVVGRDYVLEAAPHLLMEGRKSAHPTELADLFGKRFVTCQESGQGQGFDETLVKRLTGGDLIRARRMRENFWTFEPTHKLWMSSNYRPVIRGTDEGIWRRICLILFEQFIPKSERDPNLLQKLEAERDGILAWILRGWERYMREGLNPPSAVQMATNDYRSEQDVVGRFIEECLEFAPGQRVRVSDVVGRCEQWCKETGEPSIQQNDLGRRLTRRGVERKKSGVTYYLGVRLAR